ncbi:hypothetical protein AVDCRST_MAG92-3500, partial [uncultured Coleofasciculus sp.]
LDMAESARKCFQTLFASLSWVKIPLNPPDKGEL